MTYVLVGPSDDRLPISRAAILAADASWEHQFVYGKLTPYFGPCEVAPLTVEEYDRFSSTGERPTRWEAGASVNSHTQAITVIRHPVVDEQTAETPVPERTARRSSHRVVDAAGQFYAASDIRDCERLARSIGGRVELNIDPVRTNG